ncbi:MAG: hypothetical protein ACOCYT_00150 [Chloroflexota bacterium]
MRKYLYSVLILVMLIVAACGGGEDDGSEGDTAALATGATFSFGVTGADERTVTQQDGTTA